MAKEILAGNGQISLVSCPDPAQRNSEGAWQHVMHPHVCMHGTMCANLVAVLRDHDWGCVKSCISEIMESVHKALDVARGRVVTKAERGSRSFHLSIHGSRPHSAYYIIFKRNGGWVMTFPLFLSFVERWSMRWHH